MPSPLTCSGKQGCIWGVRTNGSDDICEKPKKTYRKTSKERKRDTGTTQIMLQKSDLKESSIGEASRSRVDVGENNY